MRLILSIIAVASATDPCHVLCEHDGPSICTAGSWTKGEVCHAYFYRGEPYLGDYCYHTSATAATCPASGEPVRPGHVTQLIAGGVIRGAMQYLPIISSLLAEGAAPPSMFTVSQVGQSAPGAPRIPTASLFADLMPPFDLGPSAGNLGLSILPVPRFVYEPAPFEIDEFIAHRRLDGYSINSEQISWFTRLVRGMTGEERGQLLRFITGSSELPGGTFENLSHPLIIQRSEDVDRLPYIISGTHTLVLPAYDSESVLREQVRAAIGTGDSVGMF